MTSENKPKYRIATTGERLTAAGIGAVVLGVTSYFLFDHFGPAMHLGTQSFPLKLIESGGVGLGGAVLGAALADEANLPATWKPWYQRRDRLQKTGPLV